MIYLSSLDIIKAFKNQKKPFIMKVGRSSILIQTDNNKYMVSETKRSMNELGVINMVKSDCWKWLESNYIPKFTSSDVSYYNFVERNEIDTDEIVEVDISKAYWHLALNMGIISDKTYKKGMELKKLERLSVLGAIATTRKVYEFDGENTKYLELQYNKALKPIWFLISHKLGLIMEEAIKCIGPEYFVFFWVDAFFVKESKRRELERFIISKKLKYSITRLSKVSTSVSDNNLMRITVEDRGGSKREFYEPQPLNLDEILNFIENTRKRKWQNIKH